MKTIAIYSRKSKFTEEGESIENQINMCINYAKNILCITDYEIFQDEGFSGGNINRPQFKKMMKQIKEKKFSHLICYRLDRISRNVADFTNTLQILIKNDVSFVSIKEQFDTSTAMGRAMMNISATFAQLERETIAERIKDNLRELSKTGRWLGGPAPLGYESITVENTDGKGKSRKKHILKINDTEIKIVKLVFELFIKYKSFQHVSRALESKGIYSRKGSIFSRELVKQMINNPVYVVADKKILAYLKDKGCEIYKEDSINNFNGIMPYNRRNKKGCFNKINEWIISIGEHPGIIFSDIWIECQNISSQIKLKASNRQYTSTDALLSGLVICAHCGSSMAPRNQIYKSTDNTKSLYRYYTCNLKSKASKRCDNTALNAYKAEDFVVKRIKLTTEDDILKLYLNNKERTHIKINNKESIKKLNSDIELNKKSISNLVRKVSFLDDNDPLNKTYQEEIRTILEENKKLENQIITLNNENEKIKELHESLDQIIELYANFKKFYDVVENFDDKKRLIRSVVKFVVWDSSTKTLDVVPIGSSLERTDFNNSFANKSTEQKKWHT